MKHADEFISPQSEYFIYTPSKQAREMFLYPLQCGLFYYLPGYSLVRNSFDSFLLLYVRRGELILDIEGRTRRIKEGGFMLLDCYNLHAYSTSKGCDCLWCHFDGITARAYYRSIVTKLDNAISIPDPYPILRKLSAIYDVFSTGSPVREPLLSKYLTDILTEFLLYSPADFHPHNYTVMAEEIISYINNHFSENIRVEDLASRAGMSQFHFIRTFKKETGFTPHEYIANTRMATAKYLLKNTKSPIKDICFATGFSSESVFCGAFKRHQGITPAQYRSLEESE